MMQALELTREAIVLGSAGLDVRGEMLGVDHRLPPDGGACHSARVGGVAPSRSTSPAKPCTVRWSKARDRDADRSRTGSGRDAAGVGVAANPAVPARTPRQGSTAQAAPS